MSKTKDVVLNETTQFSEDSKSCASIDPSPKLKKFDYIGLWGNGKGDNEPVAYFSLEMEEKAQEFAKAIFGEDYILAKVKLESRPLITRSNLNGAKNLILTLLNDQEKAELI